MPTPEIRIFNQNYLLIIKIEKSSSIIFVSQENVTHSITLTKVQVVHRYNNSNNNRGSPDIRVSSLRQGFHLS